MDPRSEGTQRVRTHQYVSKPQISCLASDGQGHFVLGSRLGDFRLFDGEANKAGELKRAKTLVQGLGDPVMAVDVTTDGSWVLGTCDTYLILLKTKVEGGTGFTKSAGQKKPKPIKLQLTLEDRTALGIAGCKFTPARFDANEVGVLESLIVTSLGSVAVAWDFKKVKRGGSGIWAYSIKRTEDYIVATDLSADKRVVVAYDQGVNTLSMK